MRVLVTGSSGQLGSEVVEQLKRQACETVGVDMVAGPATDHLLDLCDAAEIHRLIKGIDAVIHIASLYTPHVPLLPKQKFVDTNVSSTLTLIEPAAEANVSRFVYTSTTSVYGFSLVPADRAVWVTEALAPQPRDIYDITKLAAEQLCINMSRETDIPVVCLRVCRFFNEPPELMAIHRLYRGADLTDVARGHIQALMVELSGAHILNVAGPYPFREQDTQELLHDARSVILRYFPAAERLFAKRGWKLPTTIDRVYSSRAATGLLGYQPQAGFLEFLSGLCT